MPQHIIIGRIPNAQYNAAFIHFGRFSLNSFIRSTKSNHMQQNGASSASRTKPKILQMIEVNSETNDNTHIMKRPLAMHHDDSEIIDHRP